MKDDPTKGPRRRWVLDKDPGSYPAVWIGPLPISAIYRYTLVTVVHCPAYDLPAPLSFLLLILSIESLLTLLISIFFFSYENFAGIVQNNSSYE
jgi:hypothetical protein